MTIESTRLLPSLAYWVVYQLADGRRVVVKSFFDKDTAADYSRKLGAAYLQRLSNSYSDPGDILLLDEHRSVAWTLPFDPLLTGLAYAADSEWTADTLGLSAPLVPQVLRYSPEVSALFRYDGPAGPVAYGKVTSPSRTGEVHHAMEALARTQARRDGVLRIPRTLASMPARGLVFQEAVAGAPISSDRTNHLFAELATHAGKALAALHSSGVEVGNRRPLSSLFDRLQGGIEDLGQTYPDLARSLGRLLRRLEARASDSPEESMVPSHGDFKYDQFLRDTGGEFTLVDFDMFAQAEPALDLGSFCAYLPNSAPRHRWEDAAIAPLRAGFIRSYERTLGKRVDTDRLVLYESSMLAVRAMVYSWTQPPDWTSRFVLLMELAHERLVDSERIVRAA